MAFRRATVRSRSAPPLLFAKTPLSWALLARNNPIDQRRKMKSSRNALAGLACLSLAATAIAAEPSKKPAASEKSAAVKAPPEETRSEEETTGPQRGFKFRNLGPAAGGGRITAIAGIPGNSNVIYVGSASGGVWKTVDGGVSFKPIFEKYPPSIGAVAVDRLP